MHVESPPQPGSETPASAAPDLAARHLAVTLYRAGIAGVRRVEADVLRPLGLSFSGYRVLMRLWLLGPREPRELARVERVAVPSITSLVNTLERRGLVRRERSQVDGRLVIVSVTEAGVALARRAQREANQLEALFASVLSSEEQGIVQECLDRYLAAIGEGWPETAEARQEYSERYLAAAAGQEPPASAGEAATTAGAGRPTSSHGQA
jgi:DNA-binding MarR family transcriptional regulator